MGYLKAGYSPEQIAGTLASVHPDNPSLQVCHETIYTALYAMPRGELRTEVIGWLRFGHAKPRPRLPRTRCAPKYDSSTSTAPCSGDSRMDAYRFESGKNRLTQRILKMSKAVLVVGKDGIGYEMGRWSESRTFWQSEQENLLVADNQTRGYQHGSSEQRKRLSSNAWGMQ